MKKPKVIIWQVIMGLMPLVYVASIWNSISASVPLHFDINGKADRFGSKLELLALLLFMVGVSLGASYLIRHMEKYDPKKRIANNQPLTLKISWVMVFFISLINMYIVYETSHYNANENDNTSTKYLMAGVCLFIAVLGNFTNNVKPNYFVGIRTPWSLENEDNWKKTHHLGSRLFFFGGLLMCLLIMLLPITVTPYILISGILILTLVPFAYSYKLHRAQHQ